MNLQGIQWAESSEKPHRILETEFSKRVVAEKQLRDTKATKRRSQESQERFKRDHRGSRRPRGTNQTMLGWHWVIGLKATERDQYRSQCAGTQPIASLSGG